MASSSPFAQLGSRLAALDYSVIPLTPMSKTPGHIYKEKWRNMEWKDYQVRRPTAGEIAQWGRMPFAGIGLVCGEISGVIAIDIDSDSKLVKQAKLLMPDTPCIKVGHKGETRFYRWTGQHNFDFREPGIREAEIQLLSSGRFTVLPPSIHPKTKLEYRWTGEHPLDLLEAKDLPEFPENTIAAIKALYGMKPAASLNGSSDINSSDFDGIYDAHELLPSIPSDIGYEDWIRVGMALHHRYGSDKGLELWDTWSQSGTKYPGKDKLITHFNSFNADKSNVVTMGSLVQLAKENGYQLPVVSQTAKPTKLFKRITHAVPPELLTNAPGVLGELTRYIDATALYPSPHLSFAAALSVVGSIKAHRIASPDGVLRTNFMVVSVALSGRGKDHSRIMAKRILGQLRADDVILPDRIASGQGIVQMLRNSHGRGIWLCDEFGRLYSRTKGVQSSTANMADFLIELYNSAGGTYRGSSYADNTKAPKTDIEQPCLNIHATTVPDRFYESVHIEEVTDGFFARWLIFDLDEVELPLDSVPSVNPHDNLPLSIHRELEWWLGQSLNCSDSKTALPNTINPQRAVYDARAQLVIDQFRRDCRATANQLLKEGSELYPIYNRTAEMAVKLALTATPSYTIDESVMLWATELSLKITESMCKIIKKNIGQSDSARITSRLLEWMRDNCDKEKYSNGFARRDLSLFAPYNFRNLIAREREEILKDLIKNGYIVAQTLKSKSNGKEVVIYRFELE
jgi:hypothetical protein